MRLSRAVAVASPVTVVALVVALTWSSAASAQSAVPASFVDGVVKNVLFDPTTYLPAIVTWQSMRLDWRSSQIFFANGWFEHNPRFTTSGARDDLALGYAAGNRRILGDAVASLPLSLVNNLSERAIERALINRYPSHRAMMRTIGWIERSATASYLSYWLSSGHLRQWQKNERQSRQLGYE